MNTKLLLAIGAIVLVAGGFVVLDSLDKNRGYVDPADEPETLPSEFVLTATGGGTFNVGEPIVAGFTMAYQGDVEGKDDENSRFFVDEVTVFATSNNDATAPSGKALVPVNGTARMNGELMSFALTGYTCAKEGDASIIFTNALTRYDIAGEPQLAPQNGFPEHYSDDIYVVVKCEAATEMMQIDVNNPAFQAGTAPLGENEAETGYLHDDGYWYYNGERVDREPTILDDLED